MFLLFLDIDGVLNHGYDPARVPVQTGGWDGGTPSENEGFNYHVESCVISLNALTRATGAKIVISSSWREHHPFDELCDILKRFGVEGEIVGVTPSDVLDASGFPAPRLAEIRVFLDLFPEKVLSVAILDDCEIALDVNNVKFNDPELEHRLVRTETAVGLTPEHALRAARILATPLSG